VSVSDIGQTPSQLPFHVSGEMEKRKAQADVQIQSNVESEKKALLKMRSFRLLGRAKHPLEQGTFEVKHFGSLDKFICSGGHIMRVGSCEHMSGAAMIVALVAMILAACSRSPPVAIDASSPPPSSDDPPLTGSLPRAPIVLHAGAHAVQAPK
jgi:hypothetical protein